MKKTFLAGIGVFVLAFLITSICLIIPRLTWLSVRSLPSIARSAEPVETATVTFVGDMMFDRHIRTALARGGDEHVLGGVEELLARADMNVGNLEGPITHNPSQSQGTKVGEATNMRFTFDPAVAGILESRNFGLVSIGNNHILDFGTEGARTTTAALKRVGIAYVGDPTGGAPEPMMEEVNGVRIAFVAYSDFIGGDGERAQAAVRAARDAGADAIVVLAHWDREYETEPAPRIRALAASLAEAGATLIIGTHSHVVGAVEDIGGTRVYYSLGNFVFDQYFEPSVRCGRTVTVTFAKEGNGTRATYEETDVGMRGDGATVLGCS